jgi:hypothetical protein
MPLITITKGIGSEGPEIASRVAEGLNINLYGDAALQQMATRIGTHAQDSE